MTTPTNRTRSSRRLITMVIITLAVLGLSRYRYARLHNAECQP